MTSYHVIIFHHRLRERRKEHNECRKNSLDLQPIKLMMGQTHACLNETPVINRKVNVAKYS